VAPARAAARARMPDPVPSHALAAQVEPVEVFREILTAEKDARVEHCRLNTQVEARCSDRPDAPAAEDKVIGKEMNEST
jgi:hypothetical protein